MFNWLRRLLGVTKKAAPPVPPRPARPPAAAQPTAGSAAGASVPPRKKRPRSPTPPAAPAPPPAPPVKYAVAPPAETRSTLTPEAPAIMVGPPADLLQFGVPHRRGVETDVVVGLDFGTSSAKVVIQTPYKLSRRAVPVDFGPLGHRISRYLLPVRLAVDSHGRTTLAAEPGATSREELKVELMRQGSDDDIAWASIFLALVLREARGYFLRTQEVDYGPDRLKWAFNLGIPSAGYDDEPIKDRFGRAARAAWSLSLSAEPPTLERALATVGSRASESQDVPIAVIPEVAAEVVGYARSPQRREGLHLMLDMGASTLDVSAFCLHRPDTDDHYEILKADVQPLGLLSLHRRRIEAAAGLKPYDDLPTDPIEPLPEWKSTHPRAAELEACDSAYVDACSVVLYRTLHDLRRTRDPFSPRWGDGLPIFICGGGAAAAATKRIVALADTTARRNWDQYAGLRRELLPNPESLLTSRAKVSVEEFGRIAVAYGLSSPVTDIGIIAPPNAISDIDPTLPQNPWKDLLD
jgi:hypothetical protein